jgi:hypothetical protein
MTHEMVNGLTLGAAETFDYPMIHSQGSPPVSKLAIEMEWSTPSFKNKTAGNDTYAMRAPIVRGSPYTSMLYFNATPLIRAERRLRGQIVIDQGRGSSSLCDDPEEVLHVESEMKLAFDRADITWLIFVSEPMDFYCSEMSPELFNETVKAGKELPVGQVPVEINSAFTLRAAQRLEKGMVRIAMSNNCTFGQNPECKKRLFFFCFRISFYLFVFCFIDCGQEMKPRVNSEYEYLLRKHAQLYPTGAADIEFTFPVLTEEEETLRLIFKWQPAYMNKIKLTTNVTDYYDDPPAETFPPQKIPDHEILIFAIPHHQERLRKTEESSNFVFTAGCMPTIHGFACPVSSINHFIFIIYHFYLFSLLGERKCLVPSRTFTSNQLPFHHHSSSRDDPCHYPSRNDGSEMETASKLFAGRGRYLFLGKVIVQTRESVDCRR